jgi:para-nitrobenzyl esterase
MALKWVKKNISCFGGDPDRVTIIGQSAGGKSVNSLIVTPAAKGLFHKAVAMSGALQSITDIPTDMALTKNFLSALGLTEKNAEKLLSCPVKDILQAQEEADKTYFKAESYGPTADGITLPLDITKYIQEGNLPRIPVMIGHTLQELYLPLDADQTDIGDEGVSAKLRWKFGDNAPYVMEQYRKARASLPYTSAYGKIATEYTYVQACMRTAELFAAQGLPLWLYRWDYQGGQLANHSSDNEALFGRTNPVKLKKEPEAAAFVDRLFQDAVLSFIEDGRPRSPNLPEWKPCTQANISRLLINQELKIEILEKFDYDADFPMQAFRLK